MIDEYIQQAIILPCVYKSTLASGLNAVAIGSLLQAHESSIWETTRNVMQPCLNKVKIEWII